MPYSNPECAEKRGQCERCKNNRFSCCFDRAIHCPDFTPREEDDNATE